MADLKENTRLDITRRKLTEWLALTRWGSRVMTDEEVEVAAERIGVAPDVLMQARVLAREQGMSDIPKQKWTRLHYLGMPMAIAAEFRDRAAMVTMSREMLLRSFIHAYLIQSKWEPTRNLDGWVWRGAYLKVERGSYRNPKYKTEVRISDGAHQAMMARGARLHRRATPLLRGLVMHFLEHDLPLIIRPIAQPHMYLTAERYMQEAGLSHEQ